MKNLDLFKGKYIYHVSDGDLDGISARIIAEYFLYPVVKAYIPLNTYDRALEEFNYDLAEEADYIIFTDIHPPIDLYNKLLNNQNQNQNEIYGKVLIFDHHITSKDILPESDNFYWDDSQCGAKLFYNYISKGIRVKPILPEFINMVDTYDRYITKSELWKDAKNLHNIMFEYIDWSKKYITDTDKHLRFIRNTLYKLHNFPEWYFTKAEYQYIENANKKELKNYKQAQKSLEIRKDNEGNSYVFMTCTSKVSFVAYRIMEELGDKIDYLVAFSDYIKASLKLSIRSKNGFDCAKLAEKWGGGGHQPASAFHFEKEEDMKNFQNNMMHLI